MWSGWVNNYPGLVDTGADGAHGGFYLSNESRAYKPALTEGQQISITVLIVGAGFDENAYDPLFYNLSIAQEDPISSLPPNASYGLVDDWYNEALNVGGFRTRIDYELTADDVPSSSNQPWAVIVDYSGTGSIQLGWVSGYFGLVNTSVIDPGTIRYTTNGVWFRPSVEAGDVLGLVVQVNGASFDEGDFTIQFSQ